MVDQILAWVGNAIAAIINKLYDGVSGVLEWIVAGVEAIINVLSFQVQAIFTNIGSFMEALFSSVVDVVSSVIDGVWQFLSNAWDTIYEATVGVIDTIRQYATDVSAQITAFVADVVEGVSTWLQSVVEWIRGVAEAAIAGVQQLVAQAVQGVASVVGGVYDAIVATIIRITELLNTAWTQLVSGAFSLVERVNQSLVDIRSGFAEAAGQLVEEISGVGEEMLGPLRDAVREFADAYLPSVDEGQVRKALGALEGTHTDPQSMATFREWWASEWRDLAASGTLRKAVFMFFLTILSLAPTVMSISQQLSQVTLQEFAFQYPYQILNPADATGAWRRGIITKPEAVGQIRRGGYSERQAEQIVQLTSVVPPSHDLITMWWRGILDDKGLEQGLQHLGIDAPWTSRIREAAVIIPPVPDLIHMAVRDVWNEDAVSLGRLFEDYPDEFGQWTEKQGLSPEWAKNYWAAHWSLPSARQGFEMLHRGVITQDQLGVLLRALDVAPGWRDPLTKIAYQPYTRVDVRRMHKIGVLTEAQVTRAYRDLGYDEEKAQGLTDFTVKLNAAATLDDPTELGELSRTSILNFYTDGVLTKDKAVKLLTDAGYTPEAAQLYVDAEDMGEQRAERKSQADLLIEQAEAGVITFNEAADKLRGLGLETKEVEKAVTRLLRAEQRKTKIPSRTDADAFYVAGLMQDGDYLDLLSRNGYATKWAQLFLRLAQAKRQKARTG